MKKFNTTRRDFLTRCALMGASGATTSLAALSALTLPAAAVAARARPSQYRAMVCLYLTGGNDMNMMVPLDDYDNYAKVRGDLALDRNTLLPITSTNPGSSQNFGLHPSMSGAKSLYDDKKLAFVTNVGALLEPTTALEHANRSVLIPPKLGAHNTQKDFVQAGLPFDGRRITGWAGRVADMYATFDNVPLNLSFTGDNLWQRGASTTSYGLSGASIVATKHLEASSGQAARIRGEMFKKVNEISSNHLLVDEYRRGLQSSLALSDTLRAGIAQPGTTLNTQFPNTDTGKLLRNVAETINARDGMELPQQVFYVNLGGWDHHRGLLGGHRANLKALSDGLVAFDSALQEMGLQEQVVTFTNHEFGRTLASNGGGSDHAWGGQQIVMGGRGNSNSIVKGGDVYGINPALSPDDKQYIEFRGVLAPSTSTDQMSATIAKWFGDFSDSELIELFPSLVNFNENTLDFMG